MKKIVAIAVIAGASLALAACSGETADAPEEAPVAEATETMPAETDTMTDEDAEALDAAAAAAEGTDTNSNPIGPSATEAEAVAE